MAIAVLLLGEPLESFVGHLLVLGRQVGGAGGNG
jgi:hypothetical protein